MFSVKRKSQSGFSLVELMVVVAIIGILASIAIPSINKYMAKARQSEAKTNLSSLYTAEKAFFTEYNTFDSRFAAVGYTPEGQLRYNIGFTGGTQATAANGYNTAPANTQIAANAYCGTGATLTRGCALMNGATGSVAPIAAAMCSPIAGSTHAAACTTGTNTFRAGAGSVLTNSGTVDSWTIDDLKMLRNTVNGIQ